MRSPAAQKHPQFFGPLLSVLGVLVALALLEFGFRAVRAMGPPKPNRFDPVIAEPYPDRIFELIPKAHRFVAGSEFSIDVATNSRRLRDIEHQVAKQPRVYRVLALGDSFTFGWGVNQPDTWWSQLQRLLARDLAPRQVEIVNLGVYMYTFDQQVQRLQEFGLDYEPDLIVADFYYPHLVTISTHSYEKQCSKPWPRIMDSSFYVDHSGRLRYGKPLGLEKLREASYLFDFLVSQLQQFQYKRSKTGQLNEFELLKESRQPQFEEAWQRAHDAYELLLTLTRQRSIPVLVFMIPRDMQVWPGWNNHAAALSRKAPFQSHLPQHRFASLCQDLKMPCLDLLPQFSAAAAADPQTPLYYADDVHWTPAGHALASKLICDYLLTAVLPVCSRLSGVRSTLVPGTAGRCRPQDVYRLSIPSDRHPAQTSGSRKSFPKSPPSRQT